jgi:methyl-accepting chemotaxis protein
MILWSILVVALGIVAFHLFQEFRLLGRCFGAAKGLASLPSSTPKNRTEITNLILSVEGVSPFFSHAGSQLKRSIRLWEGEARLTTDVLGLFSAVVLEEGLLPSSTRRIFPFIVGFLGLGCGFVAFQTEQPQADIILLGMVVLACVSGLLHALVKAKTDAVILTIQKWLQRTIEPLPQAQELTRDMIFHLQEQIKGLEKTHQQSLSYMADSQGILADLGKNLQLSFSTSIEAQLSPAMTELTTMANRVQLSNQKFMEENSRNQIQAVTGMIAQVMTGIDQAIGDNLRDTSDAFAASVQRQQISMDRWRRSVDSVSDVIKSLEGTTKALTIGAEKMAHAAQPVQTAAEVFSVSAQQLQSALPAITEIAQVYEKAQSSLEIAHTSLERGTAGYLETSSCVREMVQNLREAHVEAIKRISQGVDEAVLSSLREAGSQLKDINEAQARSLSSWVTASASVEASVTQMKLTAEKMAGFSEEIRAASEPTVQASGAFLAAAERLKETVPQLQDAAKVHQLGKDALETAAQAISNEAKRYSDSANLVQQMVLQLQTVLESAVARVSSGVDDAITENLQKVSSQLAQAIVHSTDLIQKAGSNLSKQLNDASENTAITLQHSIGALSSQLDSSGSMLTQTLSASMESISLTLLNSAETAGSTLEGSMQKSSEGLQASLQTARQQLSETMTNTIRTLEGSLKSAGGELVQNWGSTGENIKDAMEHASKRLDQSVQEVGKKLNQRVDDAGRMLESSVTESANLLRQGAADAQERLSNVGTDWSAAIQDASHSLKSNAQIAGSFLSDNAKVAGENILCSADSASTLLSQAFQNSDKQIQESLQKVGKQMELSMKENHSLLSATLTTSSRDLKELSEAQSVHLVAWTEIVQTLRPALSDLRDSAIDLDGLVERLQKVIQPTTSAAQNFRVASENISTVFPNISETAKSYHDFNQSLLNATRSLASTAQQYSEAGDDMHSLLTGVRQSLQLQSKSNETVSSTLEQAADTIRSLEPISLSMRDAAGDIRLISEQTAGTVDVIHRATSSQNLSVKQMSKMSSELLEILNFQSKQLGGVTKEMGNLQQVLTSGVHAFSKALPRSVDQTLVQFDAALGEGVHRMGSAIERLREAMDDLIEQLESTKKR